MGEPELMSVSDESAAVDALTDLENDFETSAMPLEGVAEGKPHEEDEEDFFATELQPLDKLKAFCLQLMEEFLSQYKLEDTLLALQAELQRKGIARPESQLWFEMYNSCRGALKRGDIVSGSTLEKLVSFCTSSRKAGKFALDVGAPSVTLCCASPQPNSISKLKQTAFSLRQAQNQMLSPVVRPSQRRPKNGSTPSTPTVQRLQKDPLPSDSKGELAISTDFGVDDAQSRPTSSTLAPVESQQRLALPVKKHKPKKKRNHGGSDNNRAGLQHHPHPSRTESSTVMAYDERLKRDLFSNRVLARELRVLRAERVNGDALRRSSSSLEAALARHDTYAKELVRERYGFIQRVECALCTFLFLPVNLPHRVSFKCIMDLHEFWGYAPPQREVAARYRPPFCYDAVSVCRMCGPILFERTTATPNDFDELQSPTMRRASSLNVLATSFKTAKLRASKLESDKSDQRLFCSDPYALPPLFADDVIEDGDSNWIDESSGDALRGNNGTGPVLESPAKAIVYSQQQTDTTAFMTSKEWEVINPSKSTIRKVMEGTVKII